MKKKKIIAIVLFLVILVIPLRSFGQFLQPWQVASVGVQVAEKVSTTFMDITAWTIGKVVSVILYIVGVIGSLLLYLGSQFVQFMFDLNNSIMNMDIVNVGWKLTRDLANLGFVLAIIIIGFATIVRYKNYTVNELLPRLIAAAILINFSLTIAGVFLDFSSVLTKFFIDHSSNGSTASMMDNINKSFGAQKLLNISTSSITTANQGASGALQNLGTTALANIASLFFIATFTLLAALTLLGMGLMLAARFVWIAVLLIMAPIAWLFWVVPAVSGEFGKWWHNFLKWTFFPPILAFFMYLTIISQKGLDAATSTLGSQTGGSLIAGFTATASNMLIVIALLVGGLMTAQSMGMTGASAMLGLAKGAGNRVKKFAAGAAIGAGVAVGAGIGGGIAGLGRRALVSGSGKDQKGKSYLEQLSAKTPGWVNKVPVVGGLIRGASNMSSNAKAAMGKDVAEKEKKYENMTGENAVQTLNGSATRGIAMSKGDLVALGTKAAKEGKFGDIDPRLQKQIISAVRTTGTKEKILGYTPHLAGEFGMTTDQAFAKYVKDASTLSKEVLSNPEVARALRPSHISQIGALGDEEKTGGMKTGLEGEINKETVTINGVQRQALDAIREMRVNLDQQLKTIEDLKTSGASQGQILGAIGVRDTMKTQLKTTLDGLGDDNKANLRVLDSMAQNLSWQDKFKREERVMPSI